MSAESQQSDGELFALDVLEAVRCRITSITSAKNVDGYHALADLAPSIACLYYGHPDRPRRLLRRFRERPWRCARCGRWYVTTLSNATFAAEWRWTYADHQDIRPTPTTQASAPESENR